MHLRTTLLFLSIMIIPLHANYSDVITVGWGVNWHFGKSHYFSHGPEVSYWSFSKDINNTPYFPKGVEFGLEFSDDFIRIYSGFHSGVPFEIPIIGISLGPAIELSKDSIYYYIPHFGIQCSPWIGAIGYFNMRLAYFDSGFKSSYGIVCKLPVYFPDETINTHQVF